MSTEIALPTPGATAPPGTWIKRGIRRHLFAGGLAIILIVFGLGGMAATIDFAGAIVTSGRLVVDSSVKKVQHQTGGSISEIDVRDGDRVHAGQLLLRLDPTVDAANLGIVTKSLDELVARKARLEAELAGASSVAFPPDLLARLNEPEVKEVVAIETSTFESRLAARDGQRDQLGKKIAELNEQIVGMNAQQDAINRQIVLTNGELAGLNALHNKDLIPADRMSAVGREAAQLDGQLGQIIAEKGQAGAEIAQAQLQIIQIDSDMKTDVVKDLADTNSKINEASERKIAAEDQLGKLELRAPEEGTVYQLAVHSAGAVVGPGEQIMLIVPDKDVLVVEARIEPNDVDRIHAGSDAGLRFSSLGSRTTPEFTGKVLTVSPDVVVDQRTGAGYYIARVSLSADALQKLGSQLVPGMPVEVYIATGTRTVLSYLFKPLGDQILHTFRER